MNAKIKLFALLAAVAALFTNAPAFAANPCDDDNPCTIDDYFIDPDFGIICFNIDAPSGTSCDDAVYCNGEEYCDGKGKCLKRNAPNCTYLNTTCQKGVCSNSEHACLIEYFANTTPCDDKMWCTAGDHCEQGACISGEPRDCKAMNGGTDPGPCQIWECDNDARECRAIAGHENESCADDQFCVLNKRCSGGICIGDDRDCTKEVGGCAVGTCDESQKKCVVGAPLPSETKCDDGLYCTIDDHCNGNGTCVGGGTKNCSAYNTTCGEAYCDENSKSCLLDKKPLGTNCNTNQFCSINGKCDENGQCVGTPRDCSMIGSQCAPGVCQNDPPACVSQPLQHNSPCEDGRRCTIGDACDGAGHCVGGSVNPCDDGVWCTNDRCDTTSDTCVNTPQTCDDGNQCTAGDVCDASTNGCKGSPKADNTPCTIDGGGSGLCIQGVCTKGCTQNSDCNDNIACTVDICNYTTTPYTCQNLADNKKCDDKKFCTGVETCDAKLGCIAGTPPNCADTNPCTDDYCDATFGIDRCLHKANDANCADGSFCNGDERCDANIGCLPALKLRDCADENSCTNDVCNDVSKSCEHNPDDSKCDDNLYCNGQETCSLVYGCVKGPAPNCADAYDCTEDKCDESQDKCARIQRHEKCSDHIFCNGDEVCDLNLGCIPGEKRDCDDNISCTQDSCEVAYDMCAHVPVDEACQDSSYCNGREKCDAAKGCSQGKAIDCADALDCTLDVCNDDTDSCDHIPADAKCYNGKFCEGEKKCDVVAGCFSQKPPDCKDDFDCTLDFCDSNLNKCVHHSQNNLCDDSNPCTSKACSAQSGCLFNPIADLTPCETEETPINGACFQGACVDASNIDGDFSEEEEQTETAEEEEPVTEEDASDVEPETDVVTPCSSNADCHDYSTLCDLNLKLCVKTAYAKDCETCVSDLNCANAGSICVKYGKDASGICAKICSTMPVDPVCSAGYECKFVDPIYEDSDKTIACLPKTIFKDCEPPAADGDVDTTELSEPETTEPDGEIFDEEEEEASAEDENEILETADGESFDDEQPIEEVAAEANETVDLELERADKIDKEIETETVDTNKNVISGGCAGTEFAGSAWTVFVGIYLLTIILRKQQKGAAKK